MRNWSPRGELCRNHVTFWTLDRFWKSSYSLHRDSVIVLTNSLRACVLPGSMGNAIQSCCIPIPPHTFTLSAQDREQLLVALEYCVAIRRGDLDAARLLLDLDPDHLDRLADAVS